jgi:hypothetical protein
MHRILIWSDTGIRPAEYSAHPKAGYRISGRIFCSQFKSLLKYEINKESNFLKYEINKKSKFREFFKTRTKTIFCLQSIINMYYF